MTVSVFARSSTEIGLFSPFSFQNAEIPTKLMSRGDCWWVFGAPLGGNGRALDKLVENGHHHLDDGFVQDFHQNRTPYDAETSHRPCLPAESKVQRVESKTWSRIPTILRYEHYFKSYFTLSKHQHINTFD